MNGPGAAAKGWRELRTERVRGGTLLLTAVALALAAGCSNGGVPQCIPAGKAGAFNVTVGSGRGFGRLLHRT